MQSTNMNDSPRRTTCLYAITALGLTLFIIAYPDMTFQASLSGLHIWWHVVFPAMLPLSIIGTTCMHIATAYWVEHHTTARRAALLSTKAIGIWVFLHSLLISHTVGIQLVVQLRRTNVLSRQHAERWLALLPVCHPLWFIIVVGVGFFQLAPIGLYVAVIYYVSAGMTACVLYCLCDDQRTRSSERSLVTADARLSTILNMYAKENTSFGQRLGEAVSSSVQALMLLGGYIITFSVLIHLFARMKVIALPLLAGIFEIHSSAYLFSQATDYPMIYKLALFSACLGWAGLSTHLQVKASLSDTDLRYYPFLLARGLHAVIAFICTLLLWKPWHTWML